MHEEPIPGQDLYNQVRGAFIAKGETLHSWCEKNGVKRQNARAVLFGVWNGPKGRKLRSRLIEASGVTLRAA